MFKLKFGYELSVVRTEIFAKIFFSRTLSFISVFSRIWNARLSQISSITPKTKKFHYFEYFINKNRESCKERFPNLRQSYEHRENSISKNCLI